jgi:hypothetical protein
LTALLVESPPSSAAIEVIGEFIAAKVCDGPALIDVFTIPSVGECLRFNGEHDSDSGKSIGRILKGV